MSPARRAEECRVREILPPGWGADTRRGVSVRAAPMRATTPGSWKGAAEMTVLHIAHPSLDERAEHGRHAREHAPLDGHTGWRPAADRPDPVAVLDEQNRTREPDLVPVRHGR